jgi:CDP-6-deoxy-D-xylo-4-hexulose-3-dehydrase
MDKHEETLEKISEIVEEYFSSQESKEFIPGETPIRLSEPTYGSKEVTESLDSLLSTWVTMGDKVDRFEDSWADYIGTNHATMVNSGSSANLVALKALEKTVIEPGDEVIVPAVSWSTSIFPIVDINAKPVLVDVERDTYTIDVEAFKQAITPETSAVVLVHLLGNPCDMDPILELCEEHNIAIVEDCCEAHGATYKGKKVGSFGDMGTFSFFFSHHISTIEGGMIVTDSREYRKRNRTARAHGWVRELEDEQKEEYVQKSPEIDDRFLFVDHGYNLRPTEIQGSFGIHQLNKLEPYIKIRRDNASYLNDRISKHNKQFRILEERPNTRCSWFAYPLLIKESASFTRDELQTFLESRKIETRPILAGNLARQPALEQIPHRISGDLTASEDIHLNGLFIGNHHAMDEHQLQYIADVVDEFVEGKP